MQQANDTFGILPPLCVTTGAKASRFPPARDGGSKRSWAQNRMTTSRHFKPGYDGEDGVILGRVSCLVVCFGVDLHHLVIGGGVMSVNLASRISLYEFRRE